jgi:hypothetical protein
MVAPGPGYAQPYGSRSVHGLAGLNEFLRSVSAFSGGKAIIATNAPAEEVPRIFVENSLYYLLGYEAPGPMADGRYRRIRVRVNRPDVFVEPDGDRMIFSPKPGRTAAAPPAAARALSRLVPLAEEPLRLAVATIADPAAGASGEVLGHVTIALGLEVPEEAALGDVIELQLRVFDGEGRVERLARAETLRVPRTSRPGTRPVDVLLSFTLPPGRYNLRVAAHSVNRDRSGSVYTDFTVPDFARATVSLSDVVVAAAPGRSPRMLDTGAAALPALPTTARMFASSDQVSALLRVYWGRNRPGTAVEMRTTISNDTDDQVFERRSELTPEAGSGLRASDYSLDLPLKDLPAGEYLLTLTATPAGAPAIAKHVRFTVHGPARDPNDR